MIHEILDMSDMINVVDSGYDASVISCLPKKKTVNKKPLSIGLAFSQENSKWVVQSGNPESLFGFTWSETLYYIKNPHNQFPLVNIKKKTDVALLSMEFEEVRNWVSKNTNFKKQINSLTMFVESLWDEMRKREDNPYPDVLRRMELLKQALLSCDYGKMLDAFCHWLIKNYTLEELAKLDMHLMIDNADIHDSMLLDNSNTMKAISFLRKGGDVGLFGKVQIGGKTKIQPYSRNKDCQMYARYGLNSIEAIPCITKTQQERVNSTIEWLAHPERKNKTWNLIMSNNERLVFFFAAEHSSDSFKNLIAEETISNSLSIERPKKKEKAEPSNKTTDDPLCDDNLDEIESSDNGETDDPPFDDNLDEKGIETQAATVSDLYLLKDKVDMMKKVVKPNTNVKVLAVRIPDNGANSIAYSKQFTVDEVASSCQSWIDSCQKAKCKGGIYVSNLLKVVNKVWTRNSVGSSIAKKGKENTNTFKFFSVVDIFDWIHTNNQRTNTRIMSVLSQSHANLLIDIVSKRRGQLFQKNQIIQKNDNANFDYNKILAIAIHAVKQSNQPDYMIGYQFGQAIFHFEQLQIAYHLAIQKRMGMDKKSGFVPSGKEICHLSVENPWRGLKQMLSKSQVYVNWSLNNNTHKPSAFRHAIENIPSVDFSNANIKLGIALGYANV